MKKCSVDPTYQVRDDANQNLQFIKDVLLRCSERQHDEYLKSADRRMIVQYEQQLFSLVEQIEATLITQSSKANLNIRELMRVKETSGKQKHGLKD